VDIPRITRLSSSHLTGRWPSIHKSSTFSALQFLSQSHQDRGPREISVRGAVPVNRDPPPGEIAVKSKVVATSALVLVALASCATTQSNMMTSVGRLERSVDAFDTDTHGYFRNAAEFADQAHDFRTTVDRAGDREVIVAYERLWRGYQALRQEVQGSDSPQAQVALKPVTQAFRGVVRGVSGYADSAVYARGGYQHDPYYDP
jgi:hypothetical protein